MKDFIKRWLDELGIDEGYEREVIVQEVFTTFNENDWIQEDVVEEILWAVNTVKVIEDVEISEFEDKFRQLYTPEPEGWGLGEDGGFQWGKFTAFRMGPDMVTDFYHEDMGELKFEIVERFI